MTTVRKHTASHPSLSSHEYWQQQANQRDENESQSTPVTSIPLRINHMHAVQTRTLSPLSSQNTPSGSADLNQTAEFFSPSSKATVAAVANKGGASQQHRKATETTTPAIATSQLFSSKYQTTQPTRNSKYGIEEINGFLKNTQSPLLSIPISADTPSSMQKCLSLPRLSATESNTPNSKKSAAAAEVVVGVDSSPNQKKPMSIKMNSAAPSSKFFSDYVSSLDNDFDTPTNWPRLAGQQSLKQSQQNYSTAANKRKQIITSLQLQDFKSVKVDIFSSLFQNTFSLQQQQQQQQQQPSLKAPSSVIFKKQPNISAREFQANLIKNSKKSNENTGRNMSSHVSSTIDFSQSNASNFQQLSNSILPTNHKQLDSLIKQRQQLHTFGDDDEESMNRPFLYQDNIIAGFQSNRDHRSIEGQKKRLSFAATGSLNAFPKRVLEVNYDNSNYDQGIIKLRRPFLSVHQNQQPTSDESNAKGGDQQQLFYARSKEISKSNRSTMCCLPKAAAASSLSGSVVQFGLLSRKDSHHQQQLPQFTGKVAFREARTADTEKSSGFEGKFKSFLQRKPQENIVNKIFQQASE